MDKSKNNKKERGLTVIELVVSTGIFGLIITMVMGIFLLALSSQRRIIALRNVEDSIRFVTEIMAKEIKTGKSFNSDGNSISFTNYKGEAVVYRLSNNAIEKSSDGGVNYSVVTGDETSVNYLRFYLLGQPMGDGLQPRITFTIGVTSGVGNQTAELKIQTTISERLLQS